jgi:hypothetical protein
MLAALIIIGVLGIGLPLVAFYASRWRMSHPGRNPDHDELDRWLMGEFGLGWSDRAKVRQAVLGRQGTDPPGPSGPLPPRLLAPARALAERVLAGQVPQLRLSRRLGWFLLAFAPAYAGFGLFLLVSGTGKEQNQGALFVFNACCAAALAIGTAIIGPRRTRRRAETILTEAPAGPGPGRPRAGDTA